MDPTTFSHGKPQIKRHLSTSHEFDDDTYDQGSPSSYPGIRRTPEMMTRHAIQNMLLTIMQAPEVFEVYDAPGVPGIEIISSVPGERQITVRRILGVTTVELNLPT